MCYISGMQEKWNQHSIIVGGLKEVSKAVRCKLKEDHLGESNYFFGMQININNQNNDFI